MTAYSKIDQPPFPNTVTIMQEDKGVTNITKCTYIYIYIVIYIYIYIFCLSAKYVILTEDIFRF